MRSEIWLGFWCMDIAVTGHLISYAKRSMELHKSLGWEFFPISCRSYLSCRFIFRPRVCQECINFSESSLYQPFFLRPNWLEKKNTEIYNIKHEQQNSIVIFFFNNNKNNVDNRILKCKQLNFRLLNYNVYL